MYPWIDVAPDGRAFYSGPDQTMRSLDTTGTGAWQTFSQRDSLNRSYGSHAFYDIGKILVAGGGNSTTDARVIDLNGATPQVSATAPMAYGRRQHNLTVLADGSVLATGGNSSGASLVDLNNGVYPAEQWDPATGQWKTLAAMQVTRQYHSTALLLPDGRVLSSGGGICGTCDTVGYLAKNAEVFTPPYLFKHDGSGELAPRPVLDSAPAEVAYGTPFDVGTPDAASIRKLALIRLGAVTHSVNMEQRYVPLTFAAGSASLTATGPANANVAPPGMYMLVGGRRQRRALGGQDGDGQEQRRARAPRSRSRPTAPPSRRPPRSRSPRPRATPTARSPRSSSSTGRPSSARTRPRPTRTTGRAWRRAPTRSPRARRTTSGPRRRAPPGRSRSTRSNLLPSASITSPADGATFAWHPDDHHHGDGERQRRQRAEGGVLPRQRHHQARRGHVGALLYRWKNVPSGTQRLVVKATDNRGAVGAASATVTITVRPK